MPKDYEILSDSELIKSLVPIITTNDKAPIDETNRPEIFLLNVDSL
jgi:hypothetical protein